MRISFKGIIFLLNSSQTYSGMSVSNENRTNMIASMTTVCDGLYIYAISNVKHMTARVGVVEITAGNR